MTARYTTPARLARLAADLTDRDAAVLGDLSRLRLMTTAQIEALHFQAAATPAAGARACRRTMARLRNARLVRPLERRIGGVRAGSSGIVWALGVAGQRLLTRGSTPARRPWTPSPAFTAHRLAISETYVRLVLTAGPGRLVRFEAEPDAWRHYTGPGGARAWIKPDAFVLVRHEAYDEAWYLEVDRATEAPAVITRKAEAYLAHQASGQAQKELNIYPYVVASVPDQARLAVLERALAAPARRQPELFRVVLQMELVALLLGGES